MYGVECHLYKSIYQLTHIRSVVFLDTIMLKQTLIRLADVAVLGLDSLGVLKPFKSA